MSEIGDSRVGRALTRAWYEGAPSIPQRLLLSCMEPASWAFSAGARLRGVAYDRGWLRSSRVEIPVVSVGNLGVGGEGKTPVVMELVERLRARGHRPAVLTRGYGATQKGARVVADVTGLKLEAHAAGDEPALIARRCPETVVLAGPDRTELALMAASQFDATVVILDDGLQHRRLARDLDIVVVDSSQPLGNGRMLPRGPLREPQSAIRRAGLVWFSRVDEAPRLAFQSQATIESVMRRAGAPVVRSCFRPIGVTNLSGDALEPVEALRGRRVVALTGVASPRSFLHTLVGTGAEIVGEFVHADHHVFTDSELRRAADHADAHDAWLVTTEKDAARIGETDFEVRALRVELEIVEGQEVLAEALDRLSARAD